VSVRARTFTYDVVLDDAWTAASPLGETTIRNEEKEWSPEHLVLTGLCRCVLTSFRYHARRAGHEPVSSGKAHAVITRREEDGRWAMVETRLDLEVTLDPAPAADVVRALIMKGERDCFIAASLTITPDYHWTVNGEDFS
jgi:organic hydroperoxide reductase OsmC/OhrA